MKKIYLIPDGTQLEESVKLAEQCGAGFEYNDFFLPAVLDDTQKIMERIDAYAKVRSDFSDDTMHGAFLDVTLHSTDPLIREISQRRVRQSMEIAKEMGLRGVVFHTGRLYGFREPGYLANWQNTNETFFRKLLEEYPAQEVWIENMFDEAPDVMAELAERMKDCPGFGICLDYSHAVLYGGDPADWMAALAPYIRHIHINDNDLKNDSHFAVGSGSMDWQTYQALMQQYQVEASVLVEVTGVKKQRMSAAYMAQQGIYPYQKNEG